jgi:hypothetical protein
MPPETPVCNDILSRPENTRRERYWLRLTWEEAIKKDLKEWNIYPKSLLWIRVLEKWRFMYLNHDLGVRAY